MFLSSQNNAKSQFFSVHPGTNTVLGKDALNGDPNRLSDNLISRGCLKMRRCKACEIPRNEAYIGVRRSDEG
jgi:hypothetical protein